MKHKPTSHRRAIGLLLAAAALPLTPSFAQDTVPAPAQPPAVDTTPAPAPEVPAPVLVAPPAPTIAAPAPAPTMTPPPEAAPPAETTATRSRATAPRRAPAPAATRTVTRTAAPAAVAVPPAPAPSSAPLAAKPPGAEAPAVAPAPVDTAPATTAPAAEQPAQPAPALWPWLLGALILAGAAALLLTRRRRRDDVYYEETVEQPEVVAAPLMTPPLAEAPVAAPVVETGRPAIALRMHPKRAGVEDEDAVVEFELTVDNRGSAPARDVRVSTWMFAAGQSSEAEQLLIQQSGRDADLPAITIDSGGAKRIEQTVALPTSRVDEDAVLPVVVAEASYRLPDGSEERTTASFEVGVQVDDDLAYFDIQNPSGLHDDVVARPHRETADA